MENKEISKTPEGVRKKLLLYEYILYQWYIYEKQFQKDHSIEDFLEKTSRVVITKTMYLFCLGSVKSNSISLFSIFDDWIAFETGPVCEDIYTHTNCLYNFEIKNAHFILRQSQSRHSFPDLVKNNVNDLNSFSIYIKKHYPLDVAQIDLALSVVFGCPKINLLIFKRERWKLITLCQKDLWYQAHTSLERKMCVNNLENLRHEKKCVFGIN